MRRKEAIADVESIRNLVHERNVLRAAIDEIRSMAEAGMGEWVSVQPPYLPADMEVLYDIVAACDESGTTTLAGGRARVCPECGSEIAVCMMGHYCGEKTPAAKA